LGASKSTIANIVDQKLFAIAADRVENISRVKPPATTAATTQANFVRLAE
jgi:hypothetical protein